MDYIKILGTYGNKTVDKGTTCIQISDTILIDAGNIINALEEDAQKIKHIFLTHSHIDHIVDLPFLIDAYYSDQKHTLHIYALQETIDTIKKHIFNFDIYPDFSQINLINSDNKALEFNVIEYDKSYKIDNISLTPFQTNHTVASCGYIICKNEHKIMFTSDTYICDNIWDILNSDSSIKTLITEISFPSYMSELAEVSKHYTPQVLMNELKKLNRDDITIHLTHLKPNYLKELTKEAENLNLLRNNGSILHEGYIITFESTTLPQRRELDTTEIFNQLIQTAIALSSQKHAKHLDELILKSAMKLTRADAGTLYLVSKDRKKLDFKVIYNKTLDTQESHLRTSIKWPSIDIYDDNGVQNRTTAASLCVIENSLINIKDAYTTDEFNFSKTKEYDKNSGYRSKSMLVVPLSDHEQRVIGVLQLINKKDLLNKTVTFDKKDEMITRSLASQAAVSINNQKLIFDLENLLESFLHTINIAIDKKSPYTAGHIDKVADLSVMLVKSINTDQGRYRDKHYSFEEIKEVRISALMHDIGKIVIPEYIMDKHTKLETIFDRIILIRIKAEIIKRDLKIELLENLLTCNTQERDQLLEKYDTEVKSIDDDITFLTHANQGSEFFKDEDIARVKKIAKRTIIINGVKVNLLNTDEVENLCVRSGTLTKRQRDEINSHAEISLSMLQKLPFPDKLANVTQIAAGHHEKINGKGYPLGLKGDEISFEARILAIADIFEALTATDRPYKKAKKLSESMKILWNMAKDNDIDAEICEYFYSSGLYLDYANKYLKPENIDKVNLDFKSLLK